MSNGGDDSVAYVKNMKGDAQLKFDGIMKSKTCSYFYQIEELI